MDSNLIIDRYMREQAAPKKVFENKHKTWFPTGIFHQKEFYEKVRHPYSLYCLFRGHEVRGNLRTSFYRQIKQDYFDKGYIVSALSHKQIISKTGWYKSMIVSYTHKLVEWRWVRIDKIDVGKPQKQYIYILGYINEIGDDRYFMHEFL